MFIFIFFILVVIVTNYIYIFIFLNYWLRFYNFHLYKRIYFFIRRIYRRGMKSFQRKSIIIKLFLDFLSRYIFFNAVNINVAVVFIIRIDAINIITFCDNIFFIFYLIFCILVQNIKWELAPSIYFWFYLYILWIKPFLWLNLIYNLLR